MSVWRGRYLIIGSPKILSTKSIKKPISIPKWNKGNKKDWRVAAGNIKIPYRGNPILYQEENMPEIILSGMNLREG